MTDALANALAGLSSSDEEEAPRTYRRDLDESDSDDGAADVRVGEKRSRDEAAAAGGGVAALEALVDNDDESSAAGGGGGVAALEALVGDDDESSAGGNGGLAALEALVDDDDDDDDDESSGGGGGGGLAALEALVGGGDDGGDDGGLSATLAAAARRRAASRGTGIEDALRAVNFAELDAVDACLAEGGGAAPAPAAPPAAAPGAAAPAGDGDGGAPESPWDTELPTGHDCIWAAETVFGKTLLSTLDDFVARGEVSEVEARAIYVHFEKTFNEALKKPPDYMLPMPRDKKKADSLGLVAEPSCELTGTIESRNRVDGHVHMFLENVVLHEPVGGKQIHRTKIGRAEMILADQNEFDLPPEPDPNHAPRSRAKQKAPKPRGRPAAAPRVEELL